MAIILLLQGPNLNLLGTREPLQYGSVSLAAVEKRLADLAKDLQHTLLTFQSNHEGLLVERIHQAGQEGVDFLLFNPAAFTHTSVALRDAVLAVGIDMIEIHISNIYKREAFRHHSYFSDIALGVVTGFGVYGYEAALRAAHHYLNHDY